MPASGGSGARGPAEALASLLDLRGAVALAENAARALRDGGGAPPSEAVRGQLLSAIHAARARLDAIERGADVAVARAVVPRSERLAVLGAGDPVDDAARAIATVARRVGLATDEMLEVRNEVAAVLRAVGGKIAALERLDAALADATRARGAAAAVARREGTLRALEGAIARGGPREAAARSRLREAARGFVRHERRLVDALLDAAAAHLSVDTGA